MQYLWLTKTFSKTFLDENSGTMANTRGNADERKAQRKLLLNYGRLFLVCKMSLVYVIVDQPVQTIFSLAHPMTRSLSFTQTQHAHSRAQSLRLRNIICVMFHAHAYTSTRERKRCLSFFLHVSHYAKARILNLSYFLFACRFLPHILWLCFRSVPFSLFHMVFVELQFVWQ